MSGGAARSHSISPAAAPPGVATAPNPWPWPAKPGLSDATAGGCRPRAAHHRCPSPPPSPATCPSRPLPALHRLSPPLALHSPPSPPPLTSIYPLAPQCPAPRSSPYLPTRLGLGPQAGWSRTPIPASPPADLRCLALPQCHLPASSMPTPSTRS